MNLELFIVKRLIYNNTTKSKLSAPIIKIGITAIALGIIVMLISIATGVGLQKEIQSKVMQLHGQVSISTYHTRSANAMSAMPITLHDSIQFQLRSMAEVKSLYPVVYKQTLVRTDKDFEGLIFKGVDYNFDFTDFSKNIIKGRIPNYTDSLKPNKEVIVSRYFADRLELKLKDQLVCYFMKQQGNQVSKPYIRAFKIVGIFDTGFLEFDKNYAFVDLRHLQKLNKWSKSQVSQYELQTKNIALNYQNDSLLSQVQAVVPPLVQCRSIHRIFITLFEWLKLFDMNIIGIISIMILVAGINMITVLLVLILERTSMIGLLKSFGVQNIQLRKIFLLYAMYLIFKGVLLGNLIGGGICIIQYFFEPIKLDPSTYYVDAAPIYLSIQHFILVNLGTLVLCTLFLVIPTYSVSRISPIKAIYYK